MSSNHLVLCRPLLLPPSIFPSIRVFSNKSVLRIRWPKYWSFSFNISPSKEYSGLISFRMVWLDLLAAQRTLKSLLQHHSSKASILQHSAFFIVQLSHPYMTAGETTYVRKIIMVSNDDTHIADKWFTLTRLSQNGKHQVYFLHILLLLNRYIYFSLPLLAWVSALHFNFGNLGIKDSL